MTGSFPQIVSLSLEDIDEHEELARREGLSDFNYFQFSAGKHSGQYKGFSLPGMSLALADYGRTSHAITGTKPKHLHPIMLPLRIGRSLRFCRKGITEFDAFFPPRSNEVDFMIEGGIRYLAIYLTQETYLGIRRAAYGTEAGWPGDGDQVPLIGGSAIAGMKSGLSELFEAGPTAPEPGTDSVNVNDVSRSITSQIVTALSRHDAVSHGSNRERRDNRYSYVRKAREFMEAHRHESLSLAELSAEIGVSVRTLQHAFRYYYGVPPARYHLVMRLNGARNELKRRYSEETTVTEIAVRWGFWHFGRFSQFYKSQFGELPSHTLARHPTKFYAPTIKAVGAHVGG